MAKLPFKAKESAGEEGGSAARPMTVAQVNALLNEVLGDFLPATFFVQGEISNFRTYDRGHAFFTLKEPGAELPCVMWKDDLTRLKFKPKDGLAVVARGNVRLYEPQGKLQLYVETLLPRGAGALELAFRQLCEKLRAEGLFEAARKRSIPMLPQRVVVMTSRTGDVLHDVLTTAWRRYPGLHVMLYPVRVQGEQAAPEIVRAIRRVNREAERLGVDLILLVRGGGSLEDLWAFNEESVARAMVASRVLIATGIGHEPDTTIADLVGDLRGPTPTGVTELTIPDVAALRAEVDGRAALLGRDVGRLVEMGRGELERMRLEMVGAMQGAMWERAVRVEGLARQVERIEPRHAIAQGWRRVEEAQHRLERISPGSQIPRHRDRVAHLREALGRVMRGSVVAAGRMLEAAAGQLRAVSPQGVLERGYSITTDRAGTIVRSVGQVQRGDVLHTRVADGTIDSTVGKPRQETLF